MLREGGKEDARRKGKTGGNEEEGEDRREEGRKGGGERERKTRQG